jgi:hypothetical protein
VKIFYRPLKTNGLSVKHPYLCQANGCLSQQGQSVQRLLKKYIPAGKKARKSLKQEIGKRETKHRQQKQSVKHHKKALRWPAFLYRTSCISISFL